MKSIPTPSVRDSPATAPAEGRVTLRAMYAAAIDAVKADPAAAVAEYRAFLDNLVFERRARER